MANESEMRRPGSRTGSSRRTMASNSEKIALVAPMPSAREAMLNSAKTRLRRSRRTEKRRSWTNASSAVPPRVASGDLGDAQDVPEIATSGSARASPAAHAGFDAQPFLFREVKLDFVGQVLVVLGPAPDAQLQPLPPSLVANGHAAVLSGNGEP